jgi:hypothetical protein
VLRSRLLRRQGALALRDYGTKNGARKGILFRYDCADQQQPSPKACNSADYGLLSLFLKGVHEERLSPQGQ